MRYDSEEKKWSIDRHIPITILLGILAQTAFFVWWVSSFTTKTELRIDALEKQTQILSQLPTRVSAVEFKIDNTNEILRDIREEMRSMRTAQNKK